MAESCLFLSVYTPRLGNYSEPAPVMLYIHGGNFFMGTGGGLQYSLVYDSQSIVNMSRVIVRRGELLGQDDDGWSATPRRATHPATPAGLS